MKCIVSGGRQRKLGHDSDEWRTYDQGVIAQVDLVSRELLPLVDYVSPTEVCPQQEPSITFKTGQLDSLTHTYYCTTQTEILAYNVNSFERALYFSGPMLNDVHHVRPLNNGHLLVSNTGLDTVVEFSRSGEVLKEWQVLGNDTWERFDRSVDYRKIHTTKPHQSHPNYTFLYRDEIWATRFIQKDAVCLTHPGKRIALEVGNPHDGLVVGDEVYFTTTNGHIVVASLQDYTVKQVHDLNAIVRLNTVLGWCRGICILNPQQILVGFTRMRPTTVQKNVEWVKSRVLNRKSYFQLPTRIACFDLRNKVLDWEIDLEPIGINALFSIDLLEAT